MDLYGFVKCIIPWSLLPILRNEASRSPCISYHFSTCRGWSILWCSWCRGWPCSRNYSLWWLASFGTGQMQSHLNRLEKWILIGLQMLIHARKVVLKGHQIILWVLVEELLPCQLRFWSVWFNLSTWYMVDTNLYVFVLLTWTKCAFHV